MAAEALAQVCRQAVINGTAIRIIRWRIAERNRHSDSEGKFRECALQRRAALREYWNQ